MLKIFLGIFFRVEAYVNMKYLNLCYYILTYTRKHLSKIWLLHFTTKSKATVVFLDYFFIFIIKSYLLTLPRLMSHTF